MYLFRARGIGWSKEVVYEVDTVDGAPVSVEVVLKMVSKAPLLRLNSSDLGGKVGATWTCDSKGSGGAGLTVKW